MGFVGVQCSVMSDSFGSHGLQHARLPCPLLFPSLFIELVRLYIYPMLYCPLLLLPSIFPRTRVFSNESTFCIRWPKNWSFNFSVSPSNEYSELISFRIDWFHLLPVQGTLKHLLQHQSESINSLALSLLYGPPLTSIHFYWKNHNFDYTDLC